jgi:hypothetical protein
MFHVATYEADVDPVDVVDDEHDDEERQDVSFDFRDRRLQDGIGGVIRPY